MVKACVFNPGQCPLQREKPVWKGHAGVNKFSWLLPGDTGTFCASGNLRLRAAGRCCRSGCKCASRQCSRCHCATSEKGPAIQQLFPIRSVIHVLSPSLIDVYPPPVGDCRPPIPGHAHWFRQVLYTGRELLERDTSSSVWSEPVWSEPLWSEPLWYEPVWSEPFWYEPVQDSGNRLRMTQLIHPLWYFEYLKKTTEAADQTNRRQSLTPKYETYIN